MKNLPSQSQLVLPLIEACKDAGGKLRAQDAYEALQSSLNLSDEVLTETVNGGNGRRERD